MRRALPGCLVRAAPMRSASRERISAPAQEAVLQQFPRHGTSVAASPSGYNLPLIMQMPRYALVAYVRESVGEVVERLRTEVHPDLPHLPAHVTVLPPRTLPESEAAAQTMLQEVCSGVEPFQITLGDVETFVPATPTVFVRVARGAYKLRELHDKLNVGPLAYKEEFLYMPHLTIVKMTDPAQAEQAHVVARGLWQQFDGPRKISISELTFVREQHQNRWIDLSSVVLGTRLTSSQSR
jgi:2'-5' RNA ligase